MQRAKDGAQALARGSLVDGPLHTWKAIKARPLRYGLMLAGIGLAGAGAKAIGIDPEPYAIGLSALTLAWSTWKSLPALRAATGEQRLRRLGADVVWPFSLALGSTLAGKLVDHGAVAEPKTSLREAAAAGAQAGVIGIDVPTIAQTALDPSARNVRE